MPMFASILKALRRPLKRIYIVEATASVEGREDPTTRRIMTLRTALKDEGAIIAEARRLLVLEGFQPWRVEIVVPDF